MKSAEVGEFVFESHRFVKRLTGAGMDERIAEILAEEHIGPAAGNLATRTDLADTEARLREYVDGRLAELRAELMKWMFGALTAQAALIVALVKLLP